MKIHEYQGKEILKKYGVPVPVGKAAFSIEEADAAVAEVQKAAGTPVVVVKAQIHAGGRGKGGGVKVAKTADDAKAAIRKIFGMQLVTHQTGPEGKKVNRLLVEQGLDIARELYLGMTLDRAIGRVVVMASTEGGVATSTSLTAPPRATRARSASSGSSSEATPSSGESSLPSTK